MLAILCMDICVSYIPYYTFVPILPQSMEVYGVDESALNVLCILYALVYVPCAFLTGPFISRFGCWGTFIFAMSLTTVGCAMRCGAELANQVLLAPETLINGSYILGGGQSLKALTPGPCSLSFGWLVAGQVLCALGQPFLVNSTSQMGAEWFPPHERPAAAMISNLMNFIGGSLSFVIPTLLVDVSPGKPDDVSLACEQVGALLSFQFHLAFGATLLTAFLYQPSPPVPASLVHRTQVPFFADVRRCLLMKDFWLMNGQFMLYVAVCHAFDAVEGSLLERHGYSAALSSWTAVSCSVAAIVSTVIEALCITDASLYRRSLVGINSILALSCLLAFACLSFRLHEAYFVLAIGVMGLATPGWGCSFELGSEVCYPVREATVSSLLEACSNLMGVFSIVIVQSLLDGGSGASVLLLMALAAFAGGGLLLCLTGELRRTEAENEAEAAERQPALEGPSETKKGTLQGVELAELEPAAEECAAAV